MNEHYTAEERTTGLLRVLQEHLQALLSRFNQDQGGAIALLVLAATMIVFMFGLVLYDAGSIGRDKLEVQAAADTAAWSQSAVEARTMNMLAFTNVGKKVTFGMTSYYQALIISYAEVVTIATVLAIACWVANFFAMGSLTTICQKITGFAAETAYILFEEGPDIIKFETDLNSNYFKKDVKAFDDYQGYMTTLTPWWSWSEGFLRSIRNGATAASGWPVPEQKGNISGNSGVTDALPVEKPSGSLVSPYASMCARIFTNSEFDSSGSSVAATVLSDALVHNADYLLKSCAPMYGNHCTQAKAPLAEAWMRPVIYGLTALMATAQIPAGCAIQGGVFGSDGVPYDLTDAGAGANAQWLMKTSNLVIAYRAAPDRFGSERGKYDYMTKDYEHQGGALQDLIYKTGGNWAMARSEISYQFGEPSDVSNPDLWHPSWTVRMRPVALPGEWAGYGEDVTANAAWRDMFPYIGAGAAVISAAGGSFNLSASLSDMLRIELSTRGMSDEHIEGVSR